MNIDQTYITTLEIMKSKFVGFLLPIDDIAQIKPFIENIKKEHKKASHFVYAYRIKNLSKSTDDGEPHGTAGRPLLELLYKKELNDCLLLVVRYFGGTKLGASRLLRTYVNVGASLLNQIKK